jgi:4-hydroxy-2-oxoglutarate aldolase
MLLEGIFLPLTTPFYPDGRLYLRKLEHNVDRYSRTPAAGMLLLGQSGEADGLTDDETRSVLTTAIAAAAPHTVMIAGVGRESVVATLALAESAAAAGYDAIAIKGPAFAGEPSMRVETLTYFQAIADRSPLPVVLLSEPEHLLSPDLVAQLAWHPQIIGGVDSQSSPAQLAALLASTQGVSREVTVTTVFAAVTGRMLQQAKPSGPASFVSAESLGSAGSGSTALAVAPPQPALKTRTKRVGFQILAGSSSRMLDAWGAGATGGVPRLGAAAPQACCEVWQAFRDGDPELALEKQLRNARAAERVEGWSGIAALKHGCDLNGYFGGRPRLPLIALTGEQREQLEADLASLRN